MDKILGRNPRSWVDIGKEAEPPAVGADPLSFRLTALRPPPPMVLGLTSFGVCRTLCRLPKSFVSASLREPMGVSNADRV
jgi:hypothetical protein